MSDHSGLNWWEKQDLEIASGMDRANRFIAKHGREAFDAEMWALGQIQDVIAATGEWPSPEKFQEMIAAAGGCPRK